MPINTEISGIKLVPIQGLTCALYTATGLLLLGLSTPLSLWLRGNHNGALRHHTSDEQQPVDHIESVRI